MDMCACLSVCVNHVYEDGELEVCQRLKMCELFHLG